jgi:hypothetical protein
VEATRKVRKMDIKELGLTDEQLEAVQKYAQSEADKVRTNYSKQLKDANDELNKYKPKEKTEEEKTIEARLKALEDRELEISKKERQVQVKGKLEELGLPVGLADYLNFKDEADIEKVGGELATFFLENGSKPTNHSKSQPVTREQFKKMSYVQRAQLYNENPELYKTLSK